MIWSSTKQWEILLVVISKSGLRWYSSHWGVLKLRKSVTNHWVYGSHGLASRSGEVWRGGARGGGLGGGGGGGGGGRRNWIYKWGDNQKNEFFISNTVEARIPFNEEHQGLLKRHVPLGWGVFRCERKMVQSPNEGIFFEMEK